MSIEFAQVTKTFGPAKVLDALDLTIEPGDRIALIGSNGAGKTTMIRCLLGEYVHSGIVRVNGINPRTNRIKALSRISFTPQIPPLLRMPTRELVRFAADLHGANMDRIVETCGRLGLVFDEIASRPFVKLSGGQKQKILIAIAMGKDADIYVLDEPTANLDPKARRVFFELMSERADRTMLISSHRLEEVASLVNRVVEMDCGKVILDDRVEVADDPGALMLCDLKVVREEPAFEASVAEWGLQPVDGDKSLWRGHIPLADRLRFLGLLARYSGLIEHVHLVREKKAKGERQ